MSDEYINAAKCRAALLDKYIDIVSPYPDAFINNTGEGPLPPHKAKFWTTVQDHICAAGNSFMFFGYPDLYGSYRNNTSSQNTLPANLMYAIDLMNYVHIPAEHDFALTTHMHVERCARKAVVSIIRNNRHSLFRVDLHCDFAQWVVKQKKGTQILRDRN